MDPIQNLPKHQRYSSEYKRFGMYWGLGVELETYIATSQTRKVSAFTPINMKPERYSVSYYRAYQSEQLMKALARVIADVSGSGGLTVPILMNCHSLTDCDVYGEHATTYERIPRQNPRYAGQTMFEWACRYSQWFRDEFGKVFMWDGDTVEFMTQRFYCARIEDVLTELRVGQHRFVQELNRLPRVGVLAAYGPLRLTYPENPPWATYLTHQRGISMFNNGTLHVNVTLPTRLGWNRKPLCMRSFVNRHRSLARLVQWMEPIWVALYGSGDPFASSSQEGVGAAGSQRLAVSRYIGVGTYDTERMPPGKLLQVPRASLGPLPWYEWLHARTAYAPLDVIGLDINFNKHWAHGLELRFLDQMSEAGLRDVLHDLVVLMDIVQTGSSTVVNPVTDVRWQQAAGSALLEGIGWCVEAEFLSILAEVLGLRGYEPKEPRPVSVAIGHLRAAMVWRRGDCWRRMVGS
jgi:hypothetical protein